MSDPNFDQNLTEAMDSDSRRQSNSQARSTWERKAVGSQRAVAEAGSAEYFRQIRAYRYGYETPFIPSYFRFAEQRGFRVLEVGVGNGIDAVEMAKYGAIYSGIDSTRNHLELTRKNFSVSSADCPSLQVEGIIEGDLLETDLPGDYDVVYSFGVLHHIAHEQEILAKLYKLTKPGGQLKVAVYARYSFFNVWLVVTWVLKNRCRNLLSDWQSHVAEGSHLGDPVVIKIRVRREVQRMLESVGFDVQHYRRCGFVQRYLPGIGRWLQPDGVVLGLFARVLGWYHCFICRRPEADWSTHADPFN